jgi:uncharacterized protein YcnI
MSAHFKFVCAAALLAVSTAPAFSHIVLQDPAAAVATSYRATLRVGHGCGESPTTGILVTIPAGFNGAQPMPYVAHGTSYTEGVLEIRWVANGAENALPSAFFDEFVLRGTTPAKPGPVWFKVLQTCEKGSNDWTEVPVKGTDAHGLKAPAAFLEVLDIKPAGGHQH